MANLMEDFGPRKVEGLSGIICENIIIRANFGPTARLPSWFGLYWSKYGAFVRLLDLVLHSRLLSWSASCSFLLNWAHLRCDRLWLSLSNASLTYETPRKVSPSAGLWNPLARPSASWQWWKNEAYSIQPPVLLLSQCKQSQLWAADKVYSWSADCDCCWRDHSASWIAMHRSPSGSHSLRFCWGWLFS